MDFYFDLSLVQSQKIILTPQLRQALEILKMNSQELSEYIQNEMETNPALEISPGYSEPQEEVLPLLIEDTLNDSYFNSRSGYSGKSDESSDNFNNITLDNSTVRISLKEHLLLQLHILNIGQKEVEMGEYIIDNIDENGYLPINLSEVAAYFNMPLKKVEKTLKLLQTFDPPGICARDLKECLMIQLRQMDITDKEVFDIVENYLDELADNRISLIAKETGLSIGRVVEVFELIKTLEPRPGREFYCCEDVKYIVPDVIVKSINDRFEVIINEDSIPVVNVSSYYKNVLTEDLNIEAKKFIQSKIDSVHWLMKCIEHRKSTLIKVSECIVKNQADFFIKGKNNIKPLTMKELAREINVHESTVSRTVSGKYMQCSWGIFDMKYFFPLKVSSVSGVETTGDSIKMKIKGIISSEDKKSPLSDSDIVEILRKEDIEISRRTVAKYRTEMGILPSAKRKKY
ncbi:MAG: RNA polymerase factor sigma-54 [Bacillota bacterium]